MDRMLEALRVEAAAAARKDGGKAFAKARATCLCCRNCHACRDWLEAAEGLPLPADFCPNADFFRELMVAPAAVPAFDKARCGRS
jgi:hypothetical protein